MAGRARLSPARRARSGACGGALNCYIRNCCFLAQISRGTRDKLHGRSKVGGRVSRSVWSTWSLLPLSNRATHRTAGASSTHSIRFARHDRPCHPSVQFAPYPPKICAKKQDFRLYYSARRRIFEIVARRAEDRRALPAVTEKL